MESRALRALLLLCLQICFLCAQRLDAKALPGPAVVFVDQATGTYFRPPSHPHLDEEAVSPLAAASVAAALLGVDLPPGVDAALAAKIDGLLSPDPFSRPGTVLAVHVAGADGGALGNVSGSLAGPQRRLEPSAGGHGLLHELSRVAEQAGVQPLGCSPASLDRSAVEAELEGLAAEMGGSYTPGGEPATGVLQLKLHGATLEPLDLSQAADFEFASELACLLRSARQVAASRGTAGGPAAAGPLLLHAVLHGVQALKDVYGDHSSKASQGAALAMEAVARSRLQLQSAFAGRLATMVSLLGELDGSAEELSELYPQRPPVRQLLLAEPHPFAGIADLEAKALVNAVVAWMAGLILLIALIIGLCCLFRMPVTKDTLLYSGVKLD